MRGAVGGGKSGGISCLFTRAFVTTLQFAPRDLLHLRLAAFKEKQVAWREKQRLSDEWIKTVPKTDYAAIVEGLRALRRGKKVVG
jgi:hypothetical protein